MPKNIIKEERGYLILAMQDYEFEQATALAYSIKIHNKDASVTVVTNYVDRIPHHYHEAFDHMIQLPYGSQETTRTNDWQLYWATPYKNNIVIDCASLVKENHDSIWEYLEDHYDFYLIKKCNNFRGMPLTNKKFELLKQEYKLEPAYSHMFYFRHETDLSLAFFKLADVFMQNWRGVFGHYLSKAHMPDAYDNDTMYSLLNTIVLFEHPSFHNIIDTINMPDTVTSGEIGKWAKWTDRLNIWNSENAKVKIQNYAVATNLYYGEQEFLTEDIFNGHRDTYKSTAKR
jgi:hypothetical protein